MVAKLSFPCRRISRSRPATRTDVSVSMPGSSAPNSAAQLAECAIAVESHRVRVDPLGTELLDVGDPPRPLSGNVERGLLGRGIGHRRGS